MTYTNRVWRESDKVIDITIRQNSTYGIEYVLVQEVVKHRSREPCGYDYNTNCWRISAVHGFGYAERWGTDYKPVLRNVPLEYARNIITRYFGYTYHAKSDTEEIVEIAEMLKLEVKEDLEGVKHETPTRP